MVIEWKWSVEHLVGEWDVASRVSLLHFKRRCGLICIITYNQCICLDWGLISAGCFFLFLVFQFWPNSSPAAKSHSFNYSCVKLEREGNMTFELLLQIRSLDPLDVWVQAHTLPIFSFWAQYFYIFYTSYQNKSLFSNIFNASSNHFIIIPVWTCNFRPRPGNWTPNLPASNIPEVPMLISSGTCWNALFYWNCQNINTVICVCEWTDCIGAKGAAKPETQQGFPHRFTFSLSPGGTNRRRVDSFPGECMRRAPLRPRPTLSGFASYRVPDWDKCHGLTFHFHEREI